MKKFITLLISFALLISLAACTALPASNEKLTCSLEVVCSDALESDALSEEKRALLPVDGCIVEKTELSFSPGDTAFYILVTKLQEENIHFEFSETPGANSKYIEAISNLYQFDCGELSGWSYLVNGESPMVSASDYELSDGDEISFVYITDFSDM